jgi:hypothetical protein
MPIKSPKLRTVDKVKPPYEINDFSPNFGYKLGEEIIYRLAVKSTASIEGEEWEEIFANCIGAEWKPSNVGLDDVVLGSCAWGAKTVKANKPSQQKSVRLISGRNSPTYSFEDKNFINNDPNIIGGMVLSIWNERVSSIREKFKHLRTIVLIKSNDLNEVVVFEFETIRYDNEMYYWEWNNNENLEGFLKSNKAHIFTWQPHGSQFTIIENIPKNKLIVRIKIPPKMKKDDVFRIIGFDKKWIAVEKKNG